MSGNNVCVLRLDDSSNINQLANSKSWMQVPTNIIFQFYQNFAYLVNVKMLKAWFCESCKICKCTVQIKARPFMLNLHSQENQILSKLLKLYLCKLKFDKLVQLVKLACALSSLSKFYPIFSFHLWGHQIFMLHIKKLLHHNHNKCRFVQQMQ